MKIIAALLAAGLASAVGCYGCPPTIADGAALAAKNAAKLEAALVRAEDAARGDAAPLTTAEVLHDRALAKANTALAASVASWCATNKK